MVRFLLSVLAERASRIYKQIKMTFSLPDLQEGPMPELKQIWNFKKKQPLKGAKTFQSFAARKLKLNHTSKWRTSDYRDIFHWSSSPLASFDVWWPDEDGVLHGGYRGCGKSFSRLFSIRKISQTHIYSISYVADNPRSVFGFAKRTFSETNGLCIYVHL